MPAFWWHFLVSGRMSSLPLTMLGGWLTQSGVDMTDFDLSHSVSPFCYFPSGPLHMSTHIHPEKAERRSMKWDAKYCSPCDTKKKKKNVTENEQKKNEVEKQAKPLAIMRSVWLQLNRRINLTAIKSGQAFTVGWHQTRLRSQITPWRDFTL